MQELAEKLPEDKPRRGNPAWTPGVSPNPAGRPKLLEKDKKTNRELRQSALLELVRKFKPLQTKAIQAAVSILDNKESNESNKLRASALLISTYKDLLKEVYDYRYDEEAGEEIQQNNAPVFSLKMISGDTDK